MSDPLLSRLPGWIVLFCAGAATLAFPGRGLEAAPWLTFTEISYHPRDDRLEFVEIHNLDAPYVDLGGFRLEGEIDFTFDRGTRLEPRGCLVVAGDIEAFRERYPEVENVVGPFRRRLANQGGSVRLQNPTGGLAAELRYGRDGRWSAVPDGTDYTLVLADSLFDARVPESWVPSAAPGGTPGSYSARDGERAALRLNEAAVRGATEARSLAWIEIYNASDEPVRLERLFLSDDPAALRKWECPGGNEIPPRGFAVFSEPDLGADAFTGDVLFLTDTRGDRIVDALSLRALPAGLGQDSAEVASIGRYPDGSGSSYILARATRESPNRLALQSDLVLNEIHYHPSNDDRTSEFVEIFNRSSHPIPLAGIRLEGAVEYAFGDGEKIPPAKYIVVAREPAEIVRLHRLPPDSVVGPFTGKLANEGESLWLRDASGRTLDYVAFQDASPWPEAADGGGSSLELIDPRLDNALAPSWAASDESPRTEWQDVQYRSEVRAFRSMRPTAFELMLLDAGECLVDDLRVVEDGGRVAVAEAFEGDTSSWRAFGTHAESGVERESPLSSSPCYRVVASGRGNSRHNYVSLDLETSLTDGAMYTVSFRVRYLRGCPLLLTRTPGQGLARAHRLSVPSISGTPGRANSQATESPPVVGTPFQHPVAPSSSEPVRIDVRVSAGTYVATAEIRYRHERDSEWRAIPMEEQDANLWRGTIPPRPAGQVEFIVVARDHEGREGAFPREMEARPARYAVGLSVDGDLPNYTVLVSEDEWSRARSRQRMSNRLMDATLVYGTSRIFYNVGFRLRGSGFTRGSRNWRLAFGASTLDGRAKLTFDGQRDGQLLNERLTFWLLDQLQVPTPRQRFVKVDILGHGEENGVYEETEKLDGDFLARWFPGHDEAQRGTGLLYKLDDYWDFPPPERSSGTEWDDWNDPGRGWRGRRRFRGENGSYVEAYLRYTSSDPEDYRWNFPPRANGSEEEWQPLIDLLALMDPDATPTADFLTRADAAVDIDEWTRVLAGRTLANDWDSYGLDRGKNSYLYRSPSGLWKLLPWDADLSWRSGRFGRSSRRSSLFSGKFPAVERLLDQPRYRRKFLRHIAFLATKRLDPATITAVVGALEKRAGTYADRLLDSALENREQMLLQLPTVLFRVESVRRLERENGETTIDIEGTAPFMANELRLAGRSGTIDFPDERRFIARFDGIDRDVMEADARLELEAFDPDGDSVGKVAIELPSHPSTP